MAEVGATDPEVLLVEDNPGDVRLVEEALQETAGSLHITRDGREALQFLRQEDEFDDAPQPDIVLLDLNLPKVDGAQVLEEIRSDPALEGIRVVIITSARERDVDLDREAGDEDAFITKPADPDEFISVVQAAIFD